MSTRKKQKAAPATPVPKMPAGPLLHIVWVDTMGWSRWYDLEEFLARELHRDISRCETVGWLVHEDAEKIIVASSRCANGAIDGIQQIPKGTILKKTVLKEPR